MQERAVAHDTHEVPARAVATRDRTMAVLAHMTSLLGYSIPFGQFLGPYTIELLAGAESEFVRSHTREVLRFQLTILILMVACVALSPFGIGWPLLGVVLLHSLVQTIRGARAASRSERFRYHSRCVLL
jgi:uncharacterized Tic20 family protein